MVNCFISQLFNIIIIIQCKYRIKRFKNVWQAFSFLINFLNFSIYRYIQNHPLNPCFDAFTYHSNLDYPWRIIEVTKTNLLMEFHNNAQICCVLRFVHEYHYSISFHFTSSRDFIIFSIKHSIYSRKKSSKYLFNFTSRQRTFKDYHTCRTVR